MYSFALIHYDLSLSPRKTAYFLMRRIGRYEDELTCTHTHFTVETYNKTCGRDFRTTSYIYHAYLFRLYLYQLFVWNSMKLLDAYIYNKCMGLHGSRFVIKITVSGLFCDFSWGKNSCSCERSWCQISRHFQVCCRCYWYGIYKAWFI